jgi:FAD:protein FMN transferase
MEDLKAGKKINYIAYAGVVALVFALLFISLFHKRTAETVTYTKMLMGTVVEITFMEGDSERNTKAAEAAFSEIKRLEAILSSYRADSDVSRIAASAGSAVKVSSETIEVIEKALSIAKLSGGAFDPTVGSLARAWGYSGEKGTVPTEAEVKKILPLVDYRKVIVDPNATTVALKDRGMVLNLGGIAKGYIVAKAVDVLKGSGVKRGIIHAGGDMTVFNSVSAAPFTIGIQHPREKKLLGEVHISNGAVSTSGDYERYFMKDGTRYHHILNPSTGFPARGTESVTIAAEDPTLADALSTAVFVMGPVKGMELVAGLAGVEAVIVDADGKVSVSKNFKGKIF